MKKKDRVILILGIVGASVVTSISAQLFVSSIIVSSIFSKRESTLESFKSSQEYYLYKNRFDYPLLSSPKIYEFKSGKNILKANYFEGSNDGLIIVAHGLSSLSDGQISSVSNYFINKGWNIFSIDLTASGNSEGNNIGGLDQGAKDIKNALSFISKNPELSIYKDRIAMIGHSWGAYSVSAALNFNQSPKAVCSLAGFASPDLEMVDFARRYLGGLSDISKPFMDNALYQLRGKDGFLSAVDGYNKAENTSIILVQGKEDKTVSPDYSSIYAHHKEIKNKSRLTIYGDGLINRDHNNVFYDEESYEYNVKEASKRFKELAKQYGKWDNIPSELIEELKSKTSKLDEAMFDKINLIFKEAVGV